MPKVRDPCESLSGSGLDTQPRDPEGGPGNAALHSAASLQHLKSHFRIKNGSSCEGRQKSQGKLVDVDMNFASTRFYVLFGSKNLSIIPCIFTSCTCLNLSVLHKLKSTDVSKTFISLIKWFYRLSWPI